MKLHSPLSTLLLALAALASPAALAAGAVKVNFVQPEKFADIGYGSLDRERTLRALGDYLKSLGGPRLADGHTLDVEITNIDLAGETRVTPKGDLRVMRGRADWPRIDLSYTLRAGETVLKSGQAKLADMAYLSGRRTSELQTEFGHEKRMLKNWFDETFGKP